jgi:hypothetical protein
MSQQGVDILIDRLLCDEELRIRLVAEPMHTLAGVHTLGLQLTSEEIDLFVQATAWTWFLSDWEPGPHVH